MHTRLLMCVGGARTQEKHAALEAVQASLASQQHELAKVTEDLGKARSELLTQVRAPRPADPGASVACTPSEMQCLCVGALFSCACVIAGCQCPCQSAAAEACQACLLQERHPQAPPKPQCATVNPYACLPTCLPAHPCAPVTHSATAGRHAGHGAA